MTLHLRDMSITFNEGDSQLAGYYEIVLDGIYDRSAAVLAQANWEVVDVGANIGMFSIWQARRGALVIAYEPHPRAFANLLTNLEANGVESRVKCVNAAVGSSRRDSWLSTAGGSTSAHLSNGQSGDGFVVPTITLDESLATHDFEAVDLLKIDVEGAELDVIAGAGVTLERTNAVIIEVHGMPREVIDARMKRHGLEPDPGGSYPNLYYVRPSG
ncbi:MAG TPA: FkbM family methyltransferase [Chloroflexota bacterium]